LKGSGKGKTKGKEAIIFSRMESMKDSSQVKIDKLYEKFKKTNQSETKENFEAFVRKELENNNKVDEQVIQHIVNQKFS